MKNSIKKAIIATLIGATTVATVLAPTAATVLASDEECVWVDVESGTVCKADSDSEECVWVDVESGTVCRADSDDEECVWVEVKDEKQEPEYVYVEVEDSYHNKQTKTEKLDKSHYGETRYANVSDFLALRSRATSSSKELARLAPNTKMTVIGTTGNWIKVYVPSVDKDGYVYSKYASKTKR